MTEVTITDPEWNEYVMKQFAEDELDKGYPKLYGLRRVVEKLIGPIESSKINVVQQPNAENGFRVAVQCVISVSNSNISYKTKDNYEYNLNLSFSDVGEAYDGNVVGEYRQHLYAVAASRAEARVLRKILRLKVSSADEANSGVPEERINSNQITTINTICSRENINVNNMLDKFLKTFNKKDYNKLFHREGVSIIEELNNKKEEYSKEFPGYESDWQ